MRQISLGLPHDSLPFVRRRVCETRFGQRVPTRLYPRSSVSVKKGATSEDDRYRKILLRQCNSYCISLADPGVWRTLWHRRSNLRHCRFCLDGDADRVIGSFFHSATIMVGRSATLDGSDDLYCRSTNGTLVSFKAFFFLLLFTEGTYDQTF